MTDHTEEFLKLAAWFGEQEPASYHCNAPPEEGSADRYKPMLGDKIVRLATTPEHGYVTRPEALAAARTYADNCIALLRGKAA